MSYIMAVAIEFNLRETKIGKSGGGGGLGLRDGRE
jgi:hypothetical protein